MAERVSTGKGGKGISGTLFLHGSTMRAMLTQFARKTTVLQDGSLNFQGA